MNWNVIDSLATIGLICERLHGFSHEKVSIIDSGVVESGQFSIASVAIFSEHLIIRPKLSYSLRQK